MNYPFKTIIWTHVLLSWGYISVSLPFLLCFTTCNTLVRGRLKECDSWLHRNIYWMRSYILQNQIIKKKRCSLTWCFSTFPRWPKETASTCGGWNISTSLCTATSVRICFWGCANRVSAAPVSGILGNLQERFTDCFANVVSISRQMFYFSN